MRFLLAALFAVAFFGVFLAANTATQQLQSHVVSHFHVQQQAEAILSEKNAHDWDCAIKVCCDGAGCHTAQVSLTDAAFIEAAHLLLNPARVNQLLGRTLQPLTGPPRHQNV